MSWWVIPEGTIGLTIGEITTLFQHGTLGTGSPGSTGLTSLFTVTQSNTKPSGAVAGPFTTQAEAQASADAANGRITATTQPTASNVASGISQSVLGPLFQGNIWIRVGEVLLGLVLLAVGLARITHAVPVATKLAAAVGTKGLA